MFNFNFFTSQFSTILIKFIILIFLTIFKRINSLPNIGRFFLKLIILLLPQLPAIFKLFLSRFFFFFNFLLYSFPLIIRSLILFSKPRLLALV
ncbi:unnamed protein product [Meloidogyne enterolobii]|uniref:Uncharacterized protein n=1 Tax=Meloidogyne enterolobii TaxID=390850 RepID=A0ACB0YVK8_MELEN